ncbi:hypothetical protein QN222_23215 [Sinorhizobium sp. 6-70]|nr:MULTISPECIES: hypothetical protein [unclassified Sinorhizobium]MDK1377392.1 hypothetical protein [Sinorhizobium sp. 6-70]MDK1478882.1 hypothetical protein [Sinorhizobium sp. 6-117]
MRHRRGIDLAPRGDTAESALTLETLPEWYVLAARCGKCRHQAPVDRRRIARTRGGGTSLIAIAGMLKCRRCGNAEGNELLLGRLPRD